MEDTFFVEPATTEFIKKHTHTHTKLKHKKERNSMMMMSIIIIRYSTNICNTNRNNKQLYRHCCLSFLYII